MTAVSENSVYKELPTPEDTQQLGQLLAKAVLLFPIKCILLDGQLGAGKTSLARALVENLPNGDMAEIASPSFTVCNLYPSTPPVAHYDLYRIPYPALDDALLEHLEEAESLVLIEWATHLLPEVYPEMSLHVQLTIQDTGRRACFTIPSSQKKEDATNTLLKYLAQNK